MAEVPVSGGARVALIDDADLELVSQHRWSVYTNHGVTYARCRLAHGTGRQCNVRMHSLITGWRHVDHKDRNGLNNQRDNLRDGDTWRNRANERSRGGASRFKGVWSSEYGTWRACIKQYGHRTYLGTFDAQEDAARAYDAAALERFGEYACTNEMLGLY